MCEMYLDSKVHTVRDLSDPVQQAIGSYLQTPQNKYKGSGRIPKTSTKTIFTTKLATDQGTLAQQEEEDMVLGDKDKTGDK